jgi:N-methylhydantoinase A
VPAPSRAQRATCAAEGADVTDANLQLGILDPEYFLGGEMEISKSLAEQAIRSMADHFELSVDEAALGIVKIVNTNMSGLLQSMTVKRGYDPREFAMVAFGGAGPIHAAAIAKELLIPTVIVPPHSGVFSAWGMLMADLRHDLEQTYIAPLAGASAAELNGVRSLEERIRAVFEKENIEDSASRSATSWISATWGRSTRWLSRRPPG